MGLVPLIVAPFAVIAGFAYMLEAIGIYKDPMEVPFDWGFGGILYCLGLQIWLGYLWAASERRTTIQLKAFWQVSAGLNAVWVVFFFLTLIRFEHLSSPALLWMVYAIFPTVLLVLSMKGLSASHNQKTETKPNKPSQATG